MNHDNNIFDETVLPQQEKQRVPKPPTYEESLQDILERKKKLVLILNIFLKHKIFFLNRKKKMKLIMD